MQVDGLPARRHDAVVAYTSILGNHVLRVPFASQTPPWHPSIAVHPYHCIKYPHCLPASLLRDLQSWMAAARGCASMHTDPSTGEETVMDTNQHKTHVGAQASTEAGRQSEVRMGTRIGCARGHGRTRVQGLEKEGMPARGSEWDTAFTPGQNGREAEGPAALQWRG